MSTLPDRRPVSNSSKRDFYANPERKPQVVPPNFNDIPVELRSERRWILWRLEWNKSAWGKVPYQPNGRHAKSNDPTTWTTFEAVRAAHRRGDFDGIGFVLGDGIAGVDLDDVRDPETGQLSTDARRICRWLGTYAEVSPSGTGIKLIGRAPWEFGWHRRPLPAGGEIEVYDSGRYFTVTGNRIGTAGVADIQHAIHEVADRYGEGAAPAPPKRATTEHADDELVTRARAAGRAFARLWEGDTSGYQSPSEADLALCGMLARLTGGNAARVDRLFRQSGLMRDKWDEPRGNETYGELTIRRAREGTPGDDPPGAGGGSDGAADDRPTIVVGPDEFQVNDEATAALAAEPEVYQRGGLLVRVVTAPADSDPVAAVRRPPGAPVVRPFCPAMLRERMSRCARWVQAGDGATRAVHPPGWSVGAVLARGAWSGVRRLEAVVTHPALLSDGTLLATNGYDPASGLLVWTPRDLALSVPDNPTRAEVTTAVAELRDVVADFPFERSEHQAAWVAALLTPLAWFAFEGPAPLFLIDKNVRGAGAGLLADVIALTLTGRRFPVMSYTNEKEELRKKITTLAAEGERLVLLDNLAGAVGSEVLDAALTSETWKDRLLGGNRIYDGPLNVVWFGTGNNVQLAADTARRACHIRMESDQERPELRTGFKYPDLRAHVRANRGRLLSAALTVLRGWVSAGRPRHDLPAWGSFEGWSGVVREAVVFAGLPDPGATREALQTSADRDAAAMATLLPALEMLDLDGRGVTAAEVIERLKDPQSAHQVWYPDLRAAVEDLCGRLDGRTLGYRFRHFQRRNFRGRMLDKDGAAHGAVRWVVRSAGRRDGRKDPPHPPHCPPNGPDGGDGGDGEDDLARAKSDRLDGSDDADERSEADLARLRASRGSGIEFRRRPRR